jgi:(heptosyl)LPS beta-1,4-glucosyltransferase
VKYPISVIINTYNEENNVQFALSSVCSWCQEIIVVDMYSTDLTRDIAENYGARVFLHENMGFADPARAFALSHATQSWILILDADEIVPKELAKYIINFTKESGNYDGLYIPWHNYLLGKRMLGTGWAPDQDRHLRFFKQGSVKMSAEVHNYTHSIGNAVFYELPISLDLGVIHLSHLGFDQTIDKLDRYTNAEAVKLLKSGKSLSPVKAVVESSKEFINRFILKKGYKDGWIGFYLSIIMSFYKIATYSKAKHLQVYGDINSMRDRYRDIATTVIEEYKEV